MNRETAESELRWYFNDAETDVGVGSSFGAMCDRLAALTYGLASGGEYNGKKFRQVNVTHEDLADRPERMKAIGRLREIGAKLSELPLKSRRILQRYFEPTALNRLSMWFGELSNLADYLVGDALDWDSKDSKCKPLPIDVARIKKRCRDNYQKALNEYCKIQ